MKRPRRPDRLIFVFVLYAAMACSCGPDKHSAPKQVVRSFLGLIKKGRGEAAVTKYVDQEASLLRAFGDEYEEYSPLVKEEMRRLFHLSLIRMAARVHDQWDIAPFPMDGYRVEDVDADMCVVAVHARGPQPARGRRFEMTVRFRVSLTSGRLIAADGSGIFGDLGRWLKNRRDDLGCEGGLNPFRVVRFHANDDDGKLPRLSQHMLHAPSDRQTEWESPDVLTLPVRVVTVRGAVLDTRHALGTGARTTARHVINLDAGGCLWTRPAGGATEYRISWRAGEERYFGEAKDSERGSVLFAKELAGSTWKESLSTAEVLLRVDEDSRWSHVAATALLASRPGGVAVKRTSLGVRVTSGVGPGSWGVVPVRFYESKPKTRVAPGSIAKLAPVIVRVTGIQNKGGATRAVFTIDGEEHHVPWQEPLWRDVPASRARAQAFLRIESAIRATMQNAGPARQAYVYLSGRSAWRIKARDVLPVINMLVQAGATEVSTGGDF